MIKKQKIKEYFNFRENKFMLLRRKYKEMIIKNEDLKLTISDLKHQITVLGKDRRPLDYEDINVDEKIDEKLLFEKKERLRLQIQYLIDDFVNGTGYLISKIETDIITTGIEYFKNTDNQRTTIDLILRKSGKDYKIGRWIKIK